MAFFYLEFRFKLDLFSIGQPEDPESKALEWDL
jgi:hypothetical protein